MTIADTSISIDSGRSRGSASTSTMRLICSRIPPSFTPSGVTDEDDLDLGLHRLVLLNPVEIDVESELTDGIDLQVLHEGQIFTPALDLYRHQWVRAMSVQHAKQLVARYG